MIFENSICSRCGKKLRDVRNNDIIYLTTKSFIWAGEIEEILTKNNIPYLKKGDQGTGLSLKLAFPKENFDFYVPYGAYEKSKELINNILEK